MGFSHKNAIASLLELNQHIEEYADATLKHIIENKTLTPSPIRQTNGLTDLEKAELRKLDDNGHLKNALRKIIADNSACVFVPAGFSSADFVNH